MWLCVYVYVSRRVYVCVCAYVCMLAFVYMNARVCECVMNTDEHLTSQAENKISFTHPTVKKDCYKHSFLPRTMTEWNLLPPDIRQSTPVDSLKSKLHNMDLTSFIRGAHY